MNIHRFLFYKKIGYRRLATKLRDREREDETTWQKDFIYKIKVYIL